MSRAASSNRRYVSRWFLSEQRDAWYRVFVEDEDNPEGWALGIRTVVFK